MTHPAATPPTAEQVEALFPDLPEFQVPLTDDEQRLLDRLPHWDTVGEIDQQDEAIARRLEKLGLVKITRWVADPAGTIRTMGAGRLPASERTSTPPAPLSDAQMKEIGETQAIYQNLQAMPDDPEWNYPRSSVRDTLKERALQQLPLLFALAALAPAERASPVADDERDAIIGWDPKLGWNPAATLSAIRPALAVLRDICGNAKLEAGEAKAVEMLGWVDEAIAAAPAERAEAVPDGGSEAAAFPMLWEIYHAVCHLTRDGEDTTGRRQWVADALAAFEAAFPQIAHGVKFQTPVAPTPAGALDAAGAIAWRENVQNGWAALGMVREWLESRFVGALPSQEAVLQLHGPEPVHEATAIVAALDRLIPQQQSRPVTLAALADALDCFWNASLGAQQAEMTQVSCMAEGIAAVAYRLKECDRAALAAGDGGGHD